jgi:hypothetical protein
MAGRYELEFEDSFEDSALDRSRWFPYYLPHWSSKARAAARYAVGGGRLRLLIEADQEPWCPELDGDIRVSSLQTGHLDGQHRFNPAAVVREGQPPLRLYTPLYGRIELRAQANDDPRTMVALWLIGLEDEPEHSAEICICEIFGRDVSAGRVAVGVGVHPFGDPRIVDDFSRVELPIDAREMHVYASEWTPERIVFLVDGDTIKTVEQSPRYPMQLMLNIYEFPPAGGEYPKTFEIDYVRGWRYSM